jgi:predicted MFS family arabinose efflux permease
VPSAKAHFGLDEAALSALLLASAVGAFLCLMLAGRLVAWLGARGAAIAAVTLACSALASLLFLPNFALSLGVMLLFGAASSLYGMAINAEGAALEVAGERAVMSGLHGMFSLGGMTSAAVTAAMLQAGMPPASQLATLCAATGVLACVAARYMLDTHPPSGTEQANFVWPRGPLLLIGLLIMASMAAEGVMYDWSVLYMKQELLQTQGLAALGYTSFSGAMALTRFGGDRLREVVPQHRLLCYGASVAALAMLVVLCAANPWVAVVGFAAVGAGLATVVPVLYMAATLVPGTSRAAGIASASSIGFAGFMLSPPLVGAIAHTGSLTGALGVVVLAAVILAAGARHVPVS